MNIQEYVNKLRREQCGIMFLLGNKYDYYGNRDELWKRDKEISEEVKEIRCQIFMCTGRG